MPALALFRSTAIALLLAAAPAFAQTYSPQSGQAGKAVPVEGKVVGEEIILSAGGKEYRGRFQGRILELR